MNAFAHYAFIITNEYTRVKYFLVFSQKAKRFDNAKETNYNKADISFLRNGNGKEIKFFTKRRL